MFQYLSGVNMQADQLCLFSISWLFKITFQWNAWSVLTFCCWSKNKLKSLWKAKSIFDLFQFVTGLEISFRYLHSVKWKSKKRLFIQHVAANQTWWSDEPFTETCFDFYFVCIGTRTNWDCGNKNGYVVKRSLTA